MLTYIYIRRQQKKLQKNRDRAASIELFVSGISAVHLEKLKASRTACVQYVIAHLREFVVENKIDKLTKQFRKILLAKNKYWKMSNGRIRIIRRWQEDPLHFEPH